MTKQVTVYTLCEGEHIFTDGLPIASQFHAKQTLHGTDSDNKELYIPFHSVVMMVEQNSYETSPVSDANCEEDSSACDGYYLFCSYNLIDGSEAPVIVDNLLYFYATDTPNPNWDEEDFTYYSITGESSSPYIQDITNPDYGTCRISMNDNLIADSEAEVTFTIDGVCKKKVHLVQPCARVYKSKDGQILGGGDNNYFGIYQGPSETIDVLGFTNWWDWDNRQQITWDGASVDDPSLVTCLYDQSTHNVSLTGLEIGYTTLTLTYGDCVLKVPISVMD